MIILFDLDGTLIDSTDAIVSTQFLACAKEAVESASKIATLGIVTTKTGSYSEILMEHFGLMQYFVVSIGRNNTFR